MVQCHLCGTENDESEMYSVLGHGEKKYECVNENECKRLQNDYKKKQKDKQLNEIKDKHERGEECNQEDLKGFSQEEQFNLKYKYNFDDLEEMEQRLRDGCINFKHPDMDEVFSWNRLSKSWKMRKEMYSNHS